jgi:hypothetical protein
LKNEKLKMKNGTMEEVRINRKRIWAIPLILVPLLFYLYVFYAYAHRNLEYVANNRITVYTAELFIGAIAIFALMCIGLGFRTLFSKNPYLIITGESVIADGVTIIQFADVQLFKVKDFVDQYRRRLFRYVTYRYTPEAESRMQNGPFYFAPLYKKLVNSFLISNPSTGMKAQELCDLLNERLRQYRAAHKIN